MGFLLSGDEWYAEMYLEIGTAVKPLYSTFRGAAKLYWIYLSSSNSLGLFQAVTAVLANQNRQFEYKSQTVVWA